MRPVADASSRKPLLRYFRAVLLGTLPRDRRPTANRNYRCYQGTEHPARYVAGWDCLLKSPSPPLSRLSDELGNFSVW